MRPVMRCDHCKKREAEYRFFLHFQDNVSEIRLCARCMEELREYAYSMFKGFANDWSALVQRMGDFAEPMFRRENSTPEGSHADTAALDVGDGIRARRKLGELKGRLARAVAREDYERAIVLRDEIAELEKGVGIYGT